VRFNDLYVHKEGRREAFQGEQAITAALLDVSSPVKKKIYFLAGHGEMSPDDISPVRGLSVLREELRLRNYDLEGLDLSLTKRIPDGADLIIIPSPRDASSHARRNCCASTSPPMPAASSSLSTRRMSSASKPAL